MELLLLFLAVHFVADFIFQTDWQARNKSKNIRALTNHVFSYMIVFAAGAVFISIRHPEILPQLYLFVMVNVVLHWCTDFCTSKVTAYLWSQEKTHDFFVVVGFDQLIHQATIAGTIAYFYGVR